MEELRDLWPDEDRQHGALDYLAERRAREDALTLAEQRVLHAASVGLRWRETAAVYGVAPETVRRQLAWARRKLRAKNTTHAVALALRQGLIT